MIDIQRVVYKGVDRMNRDTRILYRQRGSNLRKTVDEDNILVIRTPLRLTAAHDDPLPVFEEPPIQDELFNDQHDDHISEGAPVFKKPKLPSMVTNTPIRNNSNFQVDLTNNYDTEGVERNVPLGKYQRDTGTNANFNIMSNKQLTISDASIKSIDTINKLIKFLFKDNLMKKAHTDFNKNYDQVKKMMYKIDLKIFENLVNDITNDLDDIKDINSANNKLIQQLQRVKRRKEKLNLELLQTKNEVNELMTSEDWWYKNKNEQLHLNDRLKLNHNLKQLSHILSTPSDPQQEQEQQQPKQTSQLEQFIAMLDPEDGIAAKINKISDMLRDQLA